MESFLHGLKKGNSEQWIFTCLTVTYRLDNGTATAVANSGFKAININKYHYSDTNLATLPSSFILPKASPLQVS